MDLNIYIINLCYRDLMRSNLFQNWEVLNTAVLTGRQVSQAMKVLIVSQAGQVADVTLQSSCHSEDESVLKVSSFLNVYFIYVLHFSVNNQ